MKEVRSGEEPGRASKRARTARSARSARSAHVGRNNGGHASEPPPAHSTESTAKKRTGFEPDPDSGAGAQSWAYESLDAEHWDALYAEDAAHGRDSEYLLSFESLAPHLLPLLPRPSASCARPPSRSPNINF